MRNPCYRRRLIGVCLSVEGTSENFHTVGLGPQFLCKNIAAQSPGPTTPKFVWSLFSGGNMFFQDIGLQDGVPLVRVESPHKARIF